MEYIYIYYYLKIIVCNQGYYSLVYYYLNTN